MVTLPGKDVLGEEYKDRQRSFGSPPRAQRRAAAHVAKDPRGEARGKTPASTSRNAARLPSWRRRADNRRGALVVRLEKVGAEAGQSRYQLFRLAACAAATTRAPISASSAASVSSTQRHPRIGPGGNDGHDAWAPPTRSPAKKTLAGNSWPPFQPSARAAPAYLAN